jgi:hypothetical protein
MILLIFQSDFVPEITNPSGAFSHLNFNPPVARLSCAQQRLL